MQAQDWNSNGDKIYYSDGFVGIGINDPKANLHVNGNIKAKGITSGRNRIVTEGPRKANHRGEGTQPKNGLVYRIVANLQAGAPIFQIQSRDQSVRFFAEHDGYTGATTNSAWFGGNYVNYFKSGLSIGGSTNLDAGYMLAVEGNVRARKVRVDNDAWPDYVFADTYELPSLTEVESFINEASHLPGVPSAAEVESEGVELSEMNAILLQKLEELTLLHY